MTSLKKVEENLDGAAVIQVNCLYSEVEPDSLLIEGSEQNVPLIPEYFVGEELVDFVIVRKVEWDLIDPVLLDGD